MNYVVISCMYVYNIIQLTITEYHGDGVSGSIQLFIFTDPSVINTGPGRTVCYANCYPDSPGSTSGVGVVTSQDTNFDDNNVCCNGASTMQGFTLNGQLELSMNTSCTRCK